MNFSGPFALGDWVIDPATGTMTGAAGQRRLTPKLMDLLLALARCEGSVASRDELLREVWGERSTVSDEPLTRAIAELRKTLGDDRADPCYIETIPKRGYRLIASVATARLATPAGAPLDADADAAMLGSPAHPRERAVPRRWHLVALGFAAFGLAALLVAVVVLAPKAMRPLPTTLLQAARPISVAVLRFQDLSPTSDHQYFADGVQEAIIDRLSGIPGLRVASRASVAEYGHAGDAPREAAPQFGADVLMQGTVRYDDQGVHVSMQLVDAVTNTKVWEEALDRPLTVENLFDIHNEIVDLVTARLARSLPVEAAGHAAALPTASQPAYEAYLLGKYHYRRRQPGDIQIAIDQFQIAVNADGGFADAWDWLAFAWVNAGADLGWTTPARAYPRARVAALRALELDPKLATSRAVLGYLRAVYDWDWQSGLAELERAVAAAPRESGTVFGCAYVLSLLGRHDEAIALVTDLAEALPEDGRMKQQVAERLIDAGRYGEATRAASQALAAGAEPGQVRQLLGVAAVGAGQLGTAISEFQNAMLLQQHAPRAVGYLAATYALAGRRDEARALLGELEARASAEQLDDVMLARIYFALRDRDRALELLEEAAELRLPDVSDIFNDPFFVGLRGDERFTALVGRMHLESDPHA